MIFQKTEINGIIIMKQQVHRDARGYVIEQYKQNEFEQNVQSVKFVQDYEFHVDKNVVRGLHYQKPPHTQSIIVRCVSGRIISLALDLRNGSKTYGKCLQIELNDINKLSLFIPKGFAHGFISLNDDTIVQYNCDVYFKDDATYGVNVFDATLNIAFPFEKTEAIVSVIDLKWPMLKEVKTLFVV